MEITYDFHKTKLIVTGRVIFSVECKSEIEADTYKDGIMVEQLQVISHRELMAEAVRQVTIGNATASIQSVNIGLSPTEIPHSKPLQ